MSKTAEQKALEAYPPHYQKLAGDGYFDMSLEKREGYIRGYDQALQDFLEKAEKFFNKELFTRFSGEEHHVASNKCMNLQQFIEQFKNYIKNES